MHKHQSQCIFSPSDLTRFMESPFASWMDRFALESPERAPKKDPESELTSTLARKGYALEAALEEDFAERGLSIQKIIGDCQQDKRQATLQAMEAGIDVIVQACLAKGQLLGFSDFLIKVPGKSRLGSFYYEVWDSKLAAHAKPAFLVQLCCYAEMLEPLQGVRPEQIAVVLGDGRVERYRTLDYEYYYRGLKAAFLDFQSRFDASDPPDPADSPGWADWSEYAEQLLLERDHLFQVATISRGQIKKLNCAGIDTMRALADSPVDYVPGINPAVLHRLKAQAEIQCQTKARQAEGNQVPSFKVLVPQPDEKIGLALLPPHSVLDVFFDIEGYPLLDGGLEYLWGCTYFDERGERSFRDFWAHDSQQEKSAFQAFIGWVYSRWQQDPHMHIYHYASYEIAACRKLMGRYGVCEYEVDQLLRNEVFVDLYKIVKGGLLLGEPRYSIKNVEHLYRSKRDTNVGSGGDSVIVYEQWRELHALGEQGDTWQTSSILRDIRDYNVDDCNSTQELVDWLRQQQASHNIAYLGKTDVVEPEEKEEVTQVTELRERLLQRAEQEAEKDPRQSALSENLAWMLEFHRREAKPVFWRLFDRLGLSHVELVDDLDCLANCKRTERAPFKPTPKARNLAYEYRFDPTQEFKGAAKSFYLVGEETAEGKTAKVTLLKELSDLDKGVIIVQSKAEPPRHISMVPDEYVNPSPIPQAIYQTVEAYERGALTGEKLAILDFLRRSKPRFKADYKTSRNGAIVSSDNPQQRLEEIIGAVMQLDNSYLTIQGPPGAGKSFTGKHLIAELVRCGARVGIASNSHKAINHLLLSTVKHCQSRGITAHFACTSNTDAELEVNSVAVVKNGDLAGYAKPGCVLGTTAWGFARDDMTGQLDYLFVDEAGQVAVANLIAMSRAAKNLILMGDQMQLGQPSQGAHPAESGLSVLDYLLHETPTIADDMGVFLGTTYRMHSAINRFISDHVYEGKLKSHPDNDRRLIEVPAGYEGPLDKEAGIVFLPVEHEGNTQASDEEVERIRQLASELLGRRFYSGGNDPEERLIDWGDMLFVAPYNHQVSKLRQALGEQAKVGSVDKFQGQEAPIVFLSMCASDAGDSPRGLDFLFDKHRINVAISRAQTLAVVVANPSIGQTAVTRVEQLALINLFNALAFSSAAVQGESEGMDQGEQNEWV